MHCVLRSGCRIDNGQLTIDNYGVGSADGLKCRLSVKSVLRNLPRGFPRGKRRKRWKRDIRSVSPLGRLESPRTIRKVLGDSLHTFSSVRKYGSAKRVCGCEDSSISLRFTRYDARGEVLGEADCHVAALLAMTGGTRAAGCRPYVNEGGVSAR
jgi:hypothetical protein